VYVSNEGTVCESCYDRYYSTCRICDEVSLKNDMTRVSNNIYCCDSCFSNNYFICPECPSGEDVYEQDDGIFDEELGEYYCNDHYDNSGNIDKVEANSIVSKINNTQSRLYPIENKSIDGNIIPVLNAANKKYNGEITEDVINQISSKIFGQEQKAAVETELEESSNINEVINTFNNLKQYNNYIKESYPKVKGFKPLPVKTEITNSGHKGLTIRVPVNDVLLSFAERACPGAKEAYEKYLKGKGHHDALAYIRMTKSNNALIIDNVQTDWDMQSLKYSINRVEQDYLTKKENFEFDNNNNNFKQAYEDAVGKREELQRLMPALKWWTNSISKFFIPYLLDYAKNFAKEMKVPAYLTSFEMQKSKWGRIPERSSDIYESVPAQMGFGKETYTAAPESLDEDEYEMVRVARMLKLLEILNK
jgi:hypothetical protein